MTFEDAEQKLSEIARGRFYSLAQEMSSYTSGRVEIFYKLFVDIPTLLVMSKGVSHSSWEEAFENLAKDIEVDVCLQEEQQQVDDTLKKIGCVMSATLD